jgi:BirA family biotin operon repressor/biotin-[acetyl-CoA-carboxylase] ligase
LLNGKKVSGILLETSFSEAKSDWIVLGVGINLKTHPEDTPYPATSLSGEGAKDASPEKTLSCFIAHFDRWATLWQRNGYAPIRESWLSRATGLQQKILIRLENQELSGIFKGIDETGALILSQDGKEKDRIITAGDVFFPDTMIES